MTFGSPDLTAPASTGVALRPARAGDAAAIAELWSDAWPDGHRGNVPDALAQHRRLADFRRLVPARIEQTTVATTGARIVGFVTVRDDEVEQIYVAKPARGSGTANVLLRYGEQAVAARFDLAWLAVVAGNQRARRFYVRNGWHDAGPIDYAAETASGRVPVPVRRYEKTVRQGTRFARHTRV